MSTLLNSNLFIYTSFQDYNSFDPSFVGGICEIGGFILARSGSNLAQNGAEVAQKCANLAQKWLAMAREKHTKSTLTHQKRRLFPKINTFHFFLFRDNRKFPHSGFPIAVLGRKTYIYRRVMKIP